MAGNEEIRGAGPRGRGVRLFWSHRRVERRVAGPTGLGLDRGAGNYLVVANTGDLAATTLTFTTSAVSGQEYQLRSIAASLDLPAGAQATWVLDSVRGGAPRDSVLEVTARWFDDDHKTECHQQFYVAIMSDQADL
ncbi:hypothetical protein [Solicola sp. PLA-1-18]|uniref:hypothetical protein n=1 Tax=Solicola sp. PLA-1-18 TaxID=3380532 RepID=UPI003B799FFA